ncbi:hypothetical protein A2Z33_01170 [Candidatus Gottesmanbacteria bacterium RBG_16_52_11]|uniref:Membrane protein 6-pyruvoyl-tetrahydropterin synthase-related domain-containing protein n=1 Tax=Candidatus Gottesmanbacteria bacterium RBG_16_52_11 TaxID=1798374 RepID=A0A1F5YNW7_9BACT|nr:MAG: hypothetical protein A2Z33_01170 [Candidatus Gottesmanbacteria bacterium RBG_16_52_11]
MDKRIPAKTNRFRSLIPAGLFIICISLLFHIRIFLPELSIYATHEVGINDIWHFNYPMKDLLSKSLHSYSLPVWTDLIGGGFPVLAEGQVGTFNLLNLTLFGLLPTPWAYNIAYIALFSISGMGMFLFCRRKRISYTASLIASISFMFSGFFVSHISHFVLLQSAVFFPILVYSADILLEGKKYAGFIMFSLFLSQQIFSGFPQMVFISLLFIMFYGIFRSLAERIPVSRLILLCLAIAAGFFLSSAQIFPTYEMAKLSYRSVGLDVGELLYYKFPASHFLLFLSPFAFGNPQTGSYPTANLINGSLFWESACYIGILPLLFAGIGLWRWRRIPAGAFYLLALIFFGLLMIGGSGPLYFLLTMPGFSFFRFSSRYLLVFLFLLCVLAAYGFDFLIGNLKNTGRILKIIIPGVLISLVLFDLFRTWFSYHPVIPYSQFLPDPESAAVLKKTGSGTVYSFKSNSAVFEEYTSTLSGKLNRYREYRNYLIPDSNILYGIPSVNYYAALFPTRIGEINALLGNEYMLESTPAARLTDASVRTLRIRNVSTVLSPLPLENDTLSPAVSPGIRLPVSQRQLYIYRLNNTLPKYKAYTALRPVRTLEDFSKIFVSRTFDESGELIVENEFPRISQTEQLKFSFFPEYYSGTYEKTAVEVNQDAILSVAKSYYPGWTAAVDGVPTAVFPVNLFNIGLLIPEGRHTVELRFEPDSVRTGIGITIAGYLIILLAILFRWKRRPFWKT